MTCDTQRIARLERQMELITESLGQPRFDTHTRSKLQERLVSSPGVSAGQSSNMRSELTQIVKSMVTARLLTAISVFGAKPVQLEKVFSHLPCITSSTNDFSGDIKQGCCFFASGEKGYLLTFPVFDKVYVSVTINTSHHLIEDRDLTVSWQDPFGLLAALYAGNKTLCVERVKAAVSEYVYGSGDSLRFELNPFIQLLQGQRELLFAINEQDRFFDRKCTVEIEQDDDTVLIITPYSQPLVRANKNGLLSTVWRDFTVEEQWAVITEFNAYLKTIANRSAT